MTPTISILIFIAAVFAAACVLRLLIRAALVLCFFVADLARTPEPRAGARLFDFDLPAVG